MMAGPGAVILKRHKKAGLRLRSLNTKTLTRFAISGGSGFVILIEAGNQMV